MSDVPASSATAEAGPVLIAQMSDCHIVEPGRRLGLRVDTEAFLQRAIDHVNRLAPPPDAILLTGDLVDGGGPDQYRHLVELLDALAAPVHVLPGNHDDRDALRGAFPHLPPGPSLARTVEVGPLRVVLLDDVIPGSPCGRLGAAQLAWLDATLGEEPARPTIVAVHHAPFATGIEHMDRMGLEDATEFGAVIERHPGVAAVVCGHLHRPIITSWHGTVALTAPSVAHQVALDLGPDGPGRYVLEPPAVLLHRWTPAGGLVTHVSFVGQYDGPYPFGDGPDDAA